MPKRFDQFRWCAQPTRFPGQWAGFQNWFSRMRIKWQHLNWNNCGETLGTGPRASSTVALPILALSCQRNDAGADGPSTSPTDRHGWCCSAPWRSPSLPRSLSWRRVIVVHRQRWRQSRYQFSSFVLDLRGSLSDGDKVFPGLPSAYHVANTWENYDRSLLYLFRVYRG